ncbi:MULTISPECIES: amidase domain-containing protein [Mycobacteroides]|uniref:Amidase n=2 Tax=Mycobacteroides TaxID=670516 RepID=A0A4R5P592_9MYCO|nr:MULTISPECIES: amidase domain-containing protein [Mycobacteroides]ANO02083.1 amidase [Mycobacteroides immunogenum]MBN7314503.1 amidase domain-containing protein [Mycobacteroides abscessus subsp. abscessus]MCV7307697.1 amidase domain-containing protein [Mycobacteroides immunogenum]ORA54494.1 amidase [Mycobacteroides franklinii]ORV77222.1 amidase [Mycobacteroides immunogenum]
MAAIAPSKMPTKSQIFQWTTTHLHEAATAWEKFADQSEQAFEQHVNNVRAPSGTDWTGAGATAAYDDAREAQDMVRTQCSIKRELARIARRGAEDIDGAKRATVNAIQEVEGKGYTVSEDLTVTDARSGGSDSERAARKAEAQQLTEFLRWHAQGLASTDEKVAGELTAEARGLEGRTLAGAQAMDYKTDKGSGDDLILPPDLSEARRRAIEYADKWADGNNPDYKVYPEDCTNFVSQALRAGGFKDEGDGWDDWHHGDRDDWYYNKDTFNRWNHESQTWNNAAASHDYLTQHSGRGQITGVMGTPTASGLDPLAPSKAGLVPGDLVYYKDNAGKIDHVAVYAGQVRAADGTLMDVVDQHSGTNNFHKSWAPIDPSFIGGPAQAEFVHLNYPNG